MKTTKLFIALLCITSVTAPVAAQGVVKKILPAAKKIKPNTAVVLQEPKRFVFPKQVLTAQGMHTLGQLNTALQHNIARAQLQAPQAASIPSLPMFAVLSQGIPEKTFLELSTREHLFYQQENTQAYSLLSQIKMLRSFYIQQIDADRNLINDIVTNITRIKNNFLRNMALSLWEDGDLESLQIELSQYYSLGMPFEEAAFNYTLRHPYKRNLQTMRLLHNPFISQEFKEPVLVFVNQSLISVADKEAFKQALQNLQAEYERIQQNAASTPAIKAQVNYYKQTLDDLRRFIQTNPEHRRPKWNTRNTAEQELHNRIEYLISVEKQYNYEPFAAYHQQLHALWDQHTPHYWSKQQTLQAFENFLQNAPKGLTYPRSLQDKGNISLEEELLFDNLVYWRTQGETDMNKAIREIQLRYSHNR